MNRIWSRVSIRAPLLVVNSLAGKLGDTALTNAEEFDVGHGQASNYFGICAWKSACSFSTASIALLTSILARLTGVEWEN
ncbi:hypothetical protein E0H51_26575 [Rhizobium leguminosarum bv. viciae]|nr:hypothetical protein E0H51_26575 [Rhizobium leguminosarum bv. viciae]